MYYCESVSDLLGRSAFNKLIDYRCQKLIRLFCGLYRVVYPKKCIVDII